MTSLRQKQTRKISKPLLFGLWGAGGCLIASLFGEIFLHFALPPAITPVTPSIPKVDILFVLDVTASMNEEINGVKEGIQQFSQELSSQKLDAKIGLIAFGDRLYGEESQILSFPDGVFTADPTLFRQKVAEIQQVGGGDEPESSLDALNLAANQPFRADSTKVILLITDAPPRVPDLTMKSLDEVNQSLKTHNINQLHLVIQPSDQAIYRQLQANNPGEVFLLGETASGRQGFAKILPLLGETIAQTTLQSLQSNQNYATEDRERLLMVTSVWTGILAIGIALALIMGQNAYLRRRLLGIAEGFQGTFGSVIAGIIAGAVGQLIFTPISSLSFLILLGRIVGWMLLGGLLGGGMSFFVPNLRRIRGVQGGTIGGGMGAAGFLLLSPLIGEIGGRLLGGVILGFFIGLMIALLEQLSRKAYLLIHWHEKETTTLSLGDIPIILGSHQNAHILLSKAEGFYPETAKIFQQGEEIIMEYNADYAQAKGMKKLIYLLKNGDTRKFGEIRLEVQSKDIISSS
jgi:Ca-activated chloride channel family protein